MPLKDKSLETLEEEAKLTPSSSMSLVQHGKTSKDKKRKQLANIVVLK